ncbi:hypothetical protein Cgig2_020307 [Carnegiea gigantea]|uniref:DUF4283 domain-containing protein n=1 Tax=Carnegiea gigantea TaxID=171969 RepID=A0A9Q1K9E6_9CARY|nr:hypothetical protein Cgig2_020307 [Carnegiea gigantea]
MNNISKIKSLIGIPIKNDKPTWNNTFIHYARMLVEVQLEDAHIVIRLGMNDKIVGNCTLNKSAVKFEIGNGSKEQTNETVNEEIKAMERGLGQEEPTAEIKNRLDQANVVNEIQYWNLAFLCCVLRSNPPLDVIDGFVRRIWKPLDIDKVVSIRMGLYMVRFNNLRDKETIVSKGICFLIKNVYSETLKWGTQHQQ